MGMYDEQDEMINRLVDRRPACASRNMYRSGDYDFVILLAFLAAVIVVFVLFFQYDFGHRLRPSPAAPSSSATPKGTAQNSRMHREAQKDLAGPVGVVPLEDAAGEALVSEQTLRQRRLERELLVELRAGSDDGSMRWPLRLWRSCTATSGEPHSHDVLRTILASHGLAGFPFGAAHHAKDLAATAAKYAPKIRTLIPDDEAVFARSVAHGVGDSSSPKICGRNSLIEQALVDLAGERAGVDDFVPTTVRQLRNSPHWNWTTFLRIALRDVTGVGARTPVLVKGRPFERRFTEVVEKFGSPSLHNYLALRCGQRLLML
ncbi:hypothetical protein V5799_004889 [Amblyomma americanum]|uniref:Uncharacterized protein n=1 Tax=Amblyomma americanum TaxID=6943 RepID=A0AAQ4D4T2_AMBAM